jgi:hypothetical protein
MQRLLLYAILFTPVAFSVGLALAAPAGCNCKNPMPPTDCITPNPACLGQDPCPATGLYFVQQFSLKCGVTNPPQGWNTCVGSLKPCANKYTCQIDETGCVQGQQIKDQNGFPSQAWVMAYFNPNCAVVTCP